MQKKNRVFDLQRAAVVGGRVRFENDGGFEAACADGFFRLRIPSSLDLQAGVALCKNFYLNADGSPFDPFRGFKKKDIYFDREHFQTEHIMTDGPGRKRLLPAAANCVADEMNTLAIKVLKFALRELNIAEKDWRVASGGTTEDSGTHWFACSHYRSELNVQGCPTHQDTGFVTILYIEDEGLEACVNGTWHDILPESGYFVVNFGRAFEILTSKMNAPVRSVVHRVRQVKKSDNSDRFSMASFTNTPAGGDLFVYNDGLEFFQTVRDFLVEFNKQVWNDDHGNFGLTA